MTNELITLEALAEIISELQHKMTDLQQQVEYLIKNPCRCHRKPSNSKLDHFMN